MSALCGHHLTYDFCLRLRLSEPARFAPEFQSRCQHHRKHEYADSLSKTGWSYGYVSAIDSHGRTIWIADAYRGDGKRFVVYADEELTAFIELESAIPDCGFLA
jgi:hypothetical protein